MTQTKIIVLDDDPTGSQTVHSCLLLTRWDIDTLKEGLLDSAALFFVLTNTRGMSAHDAERVTREVCVNLKQALADLAQTGQNLQTLMVSRSDSTLRGHYPRETDVMAELLGPFDAHFLIPAFFEGGRITRDSVHYLISDGKTIPVHETEFARDSVFAYANSYLPDYVEEKTQGRIAATAVERFLHTDARAEILPRLLQLSDNTCCVVDAQEQADLDYFCTQLMQAAAQGKRFLFRSAASLLSALTQLPPQPVKAQAMRDYVRAGRPGAVLVGSHVKKTTEQLQALLTMADIKAIEIDVQDIPDKRDALLKRISADAADAHARGQTSVIYTSREEKTFADQNTRLAFGQQVSALLMDVVRALPPSLGFLISKGGITSNDVLSTALALRSARVLGQILPGCSVVRCPQDHPRYALMPVVIFPGNVGGTDALATAYARLAGLPTVNHPS